MQSDTRSLSRRAFIQRSSLILAGTAAGAHWMAHDSFGQAEVKPALKIGVITDVHYADKAPAGARVYRDSLAKLKLAVDSFNESAMDIVVHNGDIIDSGDGTLEGEIAILKVVEAEFARCKAPRHYVLGNHCVEMVNKEEFCQHTAANKQSYYSFDQNGYHIVILDACFNSKMESYGRKNFVWSDANIPQAQVDWLKEDMAKNSLPTIVFVHQRLDESGQQSVKNRLAIREILEASKKVAVVIQGHSHQNSVQTINGIEYVVVRAIVENAGIENAAHSHVLAFADGSIEIKGFVKQSSYTFANA